MTDLNLAATITDGGGALTFTNPANANDGSIGSQATVPNDVKGAGTWTMILKTDLGSPLLVGTMVVVGPMNDGSTDPLWAVEYSSDASTWHPVAGYSHTYTNPGAWTSTMDFNDATARYWRLYRATVLGGLSFITGVEVDTWEIGPGSVDPGTGVDFDDDGFGTDDELAAYVMSYTITRGASAEIIGAASVGSCTIELQNTDDIFNPLNTGGLYYGKLRDGLPLWLGPNSDGAWSGTDPRGLFGGRTKDWTPNTVGGAVTAPTVTLTGEDALGWYRRTPCRIPDEIGRSQHDLRQDMLDAVGETRYTLDHEIRRLALSSFDGDLLSGLEGINAANGTRHFVKPQNDRADWYRYTTRNRQWRLDATVDASVDAASDHATADGWTLSADTVTNQQKATVTPVDFTPSSTIVWHAPTLPFTFSGTKIMWLEFDDYVDTPDPDINYTGTAPGVTLTPFGRTAKLTLTSAGTTTVTDLIVHGRLARRSLDESYVADDTASQAGSRGVRAGGDISGTFVGSLASARGLCDHIVWRYADPQFRPTVTVMNWLPDQFEIDLYDVIAVTVAELSMVAELFEVVGLTHSSSFAPSATAHLHTTTYVLQQCRVQVDPGWFVLDTSELDSAAILGY